MFSRTSVAIACVFIVSLEMTQTNTCKYTPQTGNISNDSSSKLLNLPLAICTLPLAFETENLSYNACLPYWKQKSGIHLNFSLSVVLNRFSWWKVGWYQNPILKSCPITIILITSMRMCCIGYGYEYTLFQSAPFVARVHHNGLWMT